MSFTLNSLCCYRCDSSRSYPLGCTRIPTTEQMNHIINQIIFTRKIVTFSENSKKVEITNNFNDFKFSRKTLLLTLAESLLEFPMNIISSLQPVSFFGFIDLFIGYFPLRYFTFQLP